jgi:hypothetical protein
VSDKKLNEILARNADRLMGEVLFGTTSTANTTPQEPLTLDQINRMFAGLPKPDVFLSTQIFPGDQAMTVEGGREKFTVAHPHFWLKFEHEARRNAVTPRARLILDPVFCGIRIIEIDLTGDEDEARRIWLQGYWDRLIEAIKVACVELPEWLRPAPQFSRFG